MAMTIEERLAKKAEIDSDRDPVVLAKCEHCQRKMFRSSHRIHYCSRKCKDAACGSIDAQASLYRHFSRAGVLLYIGISNNALKRIDQHQAGSGWFRQIATVTIAHYPTREEAERAEREAIINEHPLYNKTHNEIGDVGDLCAHAESFITLAETELSPAVAIVLLSRLSQSLSEIISAATGAPDIDHL